MRKKQTSRGMSKVVGDTLMIVGREVGLAMPVRSGRMRSNLIANTSGRSNFRGAYKDLGPYRPAPWQQVEMAEQTGPNLSQMMAQHRLVATAFALRRPDQPLYLTNSTPYLGEVNAGTAKQTPTGFWEKGLDRSPGKTRGLSVYGASVSGRRRIG